MTAAKNIKLSGAEGGFFQQSTSDSL